MLYIYPSSMQRSLVCCAKKAGLLLFQFPDHLELWRVGESDGHGEENTHTHTHTHTQCIVGQEMAYSFSDGKRNV